MQNIRKYIIKKYLPTIIENDLVPHINDKARKTMLHQIVKKAKIIKMIKHCHYIRISENYPIGITAVVNFLLLTIIDDIKEPIIKMKHLMHTIDKDKELSRYYNYKSNYKWDKIYPSFFTRDEILYFFNIKKMTFTAYNFIDFIVYFTLKNLIKTSINFSKHSRKNTITSRELLSSVKNNLTGKLSIHAIRELTKAITKYHSDTTSV